MPKTAKTTLKRPKTMEPSDNIVVWDPNLGEWVIPTADPTQLAHYGRRGGAGALDKEPIIAENTPMAQQGRGYYTATDFENEMDKEMDLTPNQRGGPLQLTAAHGGGTDYTGPVTLYQRGVAMALTTLPPEPGPAYDMVQLHRGGYIQNQWQPGLQHLQMPVVLPELQLNLGSEMENKLWRWKQILSTNMHMQQAPQATMQLTTLKNLGVRGRSLTTPLSTTSTPPTRRRKKDTTLLTVTHPKLPIATSPISPIQPLQLPFQSPPLAATAGRMSPLTSSTLPPSESQAPADNLKNMLITLCESCGGGPC